MDRPLACRIYPAELNPVVEFELHKKACPPEAWSEKNPTLQNGGDVVDELIRQYIDGSQEADADDADLKSRLCRALNLSAATLAEEGMLLYTPTTEQLVTALAFAVASECPPQSTTDWCFVSAARDSIEMLVQVGARVVDLAEFGAGPASFQYIPLSRSSR